LGLRPRSGQRPTPQIITRSRKTRTPGARRIAWQPCDRATRSCASELPVRRRRPFITLGCEKMGRLRTLPLDGKPCQKPAHGGGGGGATAPPRENAKPRQPRPFGGAASLGSSAGVRSTLASTRPNVQGKTPRLDGRLPRDPDAAHDATSKADASGVSTVRSWPRRAGVRPAWTHAINHELEENHGSTVGTPEPRARRVATSQHGGASRGFASARRTGVRRDANTRSARPRGLG
jgi:hypothetical protein